MLLQKIELENLLSFKHLELELRPLNVLIGANATGKSNFLRVLSLVQSLPKRDGLVRRIAEGAGPNGWFNRRTQEPPSIRLVGRTSEQFDYSIELQRSEGIEILSEDYLEEGRNEKVFERRGSHFSTSYRQFKEHYKKFGSSPEIRLSESILAEVRHPDEPKLRELADAFESIRIYSEFHTGSGSVRSGIASSALADFLQEDGGNLALVLGEIDLHGGLYRVKECLTKLFELFADVKILTRGGITQLYVREKGITEPFSSISLSDGTLRLLCLLAVLLNATPAPLICIEEPETGLHPDAIQIVAELLIEASKTTQLVVTTHSPALVDALSGEPESVVVCERDFDGFTEMKRLKSADLDLWLERYTLGRLWTKGEIGGNRW